MADATMDDVPATAAAANGSAVAAPPPASAVIKTEPADEPGPTPDNALAASSQSVKTEAADSNIPETTKQPATAEVINVGPAPVEAKVSVAAPNGGSKTEPADVEMKQLPPAGTSDATAVLSRTPARQLTGEELLRSQLAEEPRHADIWLKLLEIVLARGQLDEIRQTYDDFFRVFPTAATQWVAYLDLELAHSNFAQVESIFARCLRNTPSMELWRFYLSYTRRVNPLPPINAGSGADASEETPREKTRKVIEAAYEFCLSYIGREKDSGNIWMEYIHFIKEREVRAVYKEGQKMDDLRRVYHRALSVPLNNIELIWRDYDQWESSLNKVTAKKFLADRSAAYMTARSALREMHGLVDHLHRPALPRLPAWAAGHLPSQAYQDSKRDRELAEDWKKYLAWEAKNPLVIDDPAALQSRVLGSYKRAMMTMRFFPEIWYAASSYCSSVGRADEAVEWLKNGMEACPGSFLLSFAYVDLQESRKQTGDCSAILEALLDEVDTKIARREAAVADIKQSIDAEGQAARAALLEANRKTGAVEDLAGDEREIERQQEEKRKERKEAVDADAKPEIDELKESAALIWIKHMQFLRRTEGIRSTRTLFGKARKSPNCTWQVWEANALIEYHCSKDKTVATKVFELALQKFGEDEAFVTRYLEFLLTINDDSNARALLERIIGGFSPARARPIWDRWAEYEYAFGDLESIHKMESRLAETYPDEPPIKRFLDRNTYMDLDVISVRDMGYQPLLPGSNAAERAVAATRDLGEDGDAVATSRKTRGAAVAGTAVASHYDVAADDNGPSLKRPRLARDSASPAPGGDRKVSAGMKLKNRREGSPAPEQRPGIVERPTTLVAPIPDPVLFFMDILPRVELFDGPRLNEHDMIDCIISMNVPLPPPSAPAAMAQPPGRGGIRGRKRGGFGRRY